jgi:hypothetical protein
MPGQICFIPEQSRGSPAGKFLKVSNEVRLIVITALNGRVGPSGMRCFDGRKHSLESLHSGKELGRDTHGGSKSPLKLARAQPGLLGYGADAHLAPARFKLAHSEFEQRIVFARSLHARFQNTVERGGFFHSVQIPEQLL